MTYDTITMKFMGQPAKGYTCWCSIQFAVPAALFEYYERSNERRPGSVSLHCPLGHAMIPAGQSASQKEAARLRDDLSRERQRLDQAQAEVVRQRDRSAGLERRLSAKKGQLTRIQNRIGNGVCPCCNRYFANLHRHMTGQHPDWAEEAEGGGATAPGVQVASAEAISCDGSASDWRKLASYRRALGISLPDAASAIGVKASTLRMYESGSASSRAAGNRYAAYLNTAKGPAKTAAIPVANQLHTRNSP